jgi:hypothetical protein
MAEQAVSSGRKIGVLATLQTTLAPTLQLLKDTASARDLHREFVSCLADGAFDAVLAGDVATHDRLVGASLTELSAAVDVVVLAQASMARVVANLPAGDQRIPILSSPELAVAHAAEVIATGTIDPGRTPGTSVQSSHR